MEGEWQAGEVSEGYGAALQRQGRLHVIVVAGQYSESASVTGRSGRQKRRRMAQRHRRLRGKTLPVVRPAVRREPSVLGGRQLTQREEPPCDVDCAILRGDSWLAISLSPSPFTAVYAAEARLSVRHVLFVGWQEGRSATGVSSSRALVNQQHTASAGWKEGGGRTRRVFY